LSDEPFERRIGHYQALNLGGIQWDPQMAERRSQMARCHEPSVEEIAMEISVNNDQKSAAPRDARRLVELLD